MWTFNVDLVLEADGKVYRGSGSYSGAASMYYDGSGLDTLALATERALAAALGTAAPDDAKRKEPSKPNDADRKERAERNGADRRQQAERNDADRKQRTVSKAEEGGS